ncbi:MAG: ATP-binding protein [Paludibacteraceae bacterium]|nr:ATP-binding protein [Paludibacteraceae bacterium]
MNSLDATAFTLFGIDVSWEFLLSTLLIPLTLSLIGLIVKRTITAIKARRENGKEPVVVLSRRKIERQPRYVMGNRAEESRGFRKGEKYYIRRKVDDQLAEVLDKRQYPIVFVTGMYGIGKSRAVYQYLTGEKSSSTFKKILVLSGLQLSCDSEQLLDKLRKKAGKGSLLFIDNIQEVRLKDIVPAADLAETSPKALLTPWLAILQEMSEMGVTTVISLVNIGKESSRLLENGDLPEETFAGKWTEIVMPTVERGSDDHQRCQALFPKVREYSPYIGNYVNQWNCERLLSDVVKTQGSRLLLTSYLFISRYSNTRSKDKKRLREVYETICRQVPNYQRWADQSGTEEEQQEEFEKVYASLKKSHIFSRSRLTELNDPAFGKYFSEYMQKSVRDAGEHPNGIELLCATLLADRSLLLLHQEKLQADVLMKITPDSPLLYARAVTRATAQNERQIAQYVKSRFDSRFFEQREGVPYLKDKGLAAECAKAIGVIVSRGYSNWEEHIETYRKAYEAAGEDIAAQDDIISELLHIASDRRTSSEERERVLGYIAGTLKTDVKERAKKSLRIAINYETATKGYDRERVRNVLSLLLEQAEETAEQLKALDAAAESEEKRAEGEDRFYYLRRDLGSWANILLGKITSAKECEALLTILYQKDTVEMLQRLQEVMLGTDIRVTAKRISPRFMVFTPPATSKIAAQVKSRRPLDYVQELEQILKQFVKHLKRKNGSKPISHCEQILTVHSIEGFVIYIQGNKKTGVMSSLSRFGDALHWYKMVGELFSELSESSTLYLHILLHHVFSTIRTKENFERAKVVLDQYLKKGSDKAGKLKLYNSLLSNTPDWETAVAFAKDEYIQQEMDIITVNTFLNKAKDQLFTLCKSLRITYEKGEGRLTEEEKKLFQQVVDEIGNVLKLAKDRALQWDEQTQSILMEIRQRMDEGVVSYNKESVSISSQLKHTEGLSADPSIAASKIHNAQTESILEVQRLKKLTVGDIYDKLVLIEAYCEHPESNSTLPMNSRLSSDMLTHLLQTLQDNIRNNTTDWQAFEEKDALEAVVERLVFEKRPDLLFPPKIYYYRAIVTLAMTTEWAEDENGKSIVKKRSCIAGLDTPEERKRFMEGAFARLLDCDTPLHVSQDELQKKGKGEQNLPEMLLGNCRFDDALQLVGYAKDLSRLPALNGVYTPLAIKMLCNKCRDGIKEVNFGNHQLMLRRIDAINRLLSDTEQMLHFDIDNIKLISAFNRDLRQRSNKNKHQVFFPRMDKETRVCIPLHALHNPVVRHRAWEDYKKQHYLDKLAANTIQQFAFCEMADICLLLGRRKQTSGRKPSVTIAEADYLKEASEILQAKGQPLDKIQIAYWQNWPSGITAQAETNGMKQLKSHLSQGSCSEREIPAWKGQWEAIEAYASDVEEHLASAEEDSEQKRQERINYFNLQKEIWEKKNGGRTDGNEA